MTTEEKAAVDETKKVLDKVFNNQEDYLKPQFINLTEEQEEVIK